MKNGELRTTSKSYNKNNKYNNLMTWNINS